MGKPRDLAGSFLKSLIRRKPIDAGLGDSKLNRCLSTTDLTFLGIGSTLGLGIYVLAGQVASEKAGPAVTLSFLIAAIASVFAGLCYAEFGARVPRAGSAYVYSYVTVGEFMAFIIGWNLILEYVIGTASVARGYSGYIDSLFDGTIQKHLEAAMPINIKDVSSYPDFLSLGITLLLTIMLAVGVKESTRFNTIFTCLNLLVVVFAIIAGSIKSNTDNWKIDVTTRNGTEHAGKGGFFPFGVSGMMAGAATCFYGFIGFDCIATTGEEVKNPQKSIPISIVLSLLFVFLAYFGVSAVQTLMVPYYLQNVQAPLPWVFEQVGWEFARWIISIGAIAGLSTSLLGAMFPLPRVLYAMASDGIIFKTLANVHPKLKTPLFATIFSGVFAGVMAMMFNVHELADMMSIGTLLAYTLVAVCVVILRYKPVEARALPHGPSRSSYSYVPDSPENSELTKSKELNCNGSSYVPPNRTMVVYDVIRQLLNLDGYKEPTRFTSAVSCVLIAIIAALVITLDAIIAFAEDQLVALDIATYTAIGCLLILIFAALVMLKTQPVDNAKISFKVPLVPFIPVLSIFVNIYLMFKLSVLTWKRFGVWMALGFAVYFMYGIWFSAERRNTQVSGSAINSRETESNLVNSPQEYLSATPSAPDHEEENTKELTVTSKPKTKSNITYENSV